MAGTVTGWQENIICNMLWHICLQPDMGVRVYDSGMTLN